jgi:hypothetical protein
LAAQIPATLGTKTAANSLSVTVASDQVLDVAADQLPASLGAKTTANSLAVNIASDQTVPVSASALPLPTGAATSANQTALAAQIPATLGAKASAASLSVVVASDQTVPVSASALPLPSGAATSANQTTLGSQTTKLNDGTNTATVKAASTAPQAADTALVVAVSPNTPTLPVQLAAGSAIVGKVTTDQTSHGTSDLVAADITKVGGAAVALGQTTKSASIPVTLPTDVGTLNVLAQAGTAIIGKVTTDQTTHGTTDLVAADITKVGGATLALGQAAKAASVPVVLASDSVPLLASGGHFLPGYDLDTGHADSGTLSIDPDGSLNARAMVLTDNGTYRVNFANSSLAVTLGTCTFTNGSKTVTGTGFLTTDVDMGCYVKLTADSDDKYVQVEDVASDTTITLKTPYQGSSTTGAGSRVLLKPVIGTNSTITVASGACTIASGTTANIYSEIERDVDWSPLVKQCSVAVSQRTALQYTRIGFYDEQHPATPYYFAWFLLDGTTNTTVKTVTGRNPTGAPSASETETQTVNYPAGTTSASANVYRVELMTDRCSFYINDVLVATHTRSLPGAGDFLTSTIRITNDVAYAGSSTNVVVDYDVCKNHDVINIGSFGRAESITANTAPPVVANYNVAGIITINTDLLKIDCSSFSDITVHCSSMGSSGVVTPYWSNDETVAPGVATSLYVHNTGVVAATFNAAGLWTTPVVGKILTLRLTTATTAGTTTIFVRGHQRAARPAQLIAVQPTAANLNATVTATNLSCNVAQVGGTNTVSGGVNGTLAVGGTAAHSAAATGNPVRVGAKAQTANDGTIANADIADLQVTLTGAVVNRPFSIPENEWVGIDSITNSTTATQLKAGTASNKTYVSGLTIGSDTLGAAGEIQLRSTPIASTSATISANTLVMAGTYNWKVGDLVYVTASTVTGLSAGSYYYLLTVSAANLTFSATRGGGTLAISGTTVSATLAKVLWRHKLQTTSLPLTAVKFPNPVDGGTGLAVEMCTPTALTSGRVDFDVYGFVAP